MSDDDRKKKLRARNWILGGILMALVVLFYFITVVKMSGA
jgi:hypothetical protein